MLGPNSTACRRAHQRSGFTLVELMMVIGILVVLITITWVAMGGSLATSRIKATQATIRKIDGLLTRRLEALEREYEKDGYPNTNAAGILQRKRLFKDFFPQMLEEITDTSVATNSTSPTASAEALYWFLTETAALDTDDVDSDMFSSSEVMDTDGNGRLEFVDAWERPIRFYRWPTRLIRPSATPTQNQTYTGGASPSYAIPLDPAFKVFGTSAGGASAMAMIPSIPPEVVDTRPGSPTNGQVIQRGSGMTIHGELIDPLAKDSDDPLGFTHPTHTKFSENFTNVPTFEDTFHTPETWSVPIIVSAGPDGELGLFEPHDTANHGHLAQPDPAALQAILDNITNRNLQSGGQ